VHANDSLELRIIKFTSLNATKSDIKSHEIFSNIYIYIMKDTTLEDLTKCTKKTRSELLNHYCHLPILSQ
jgi:hypothetical protein